MMEKQALSSPAAECFWRKISVQNSGQTKSQFEVTGDLLIRYGLVLVIGWIGAMKFTSYEANGIQPLVANSPIMGWLYGFLSVQGFSNLLGVVEIAIAVMIGMRWLSPRVSAIGSVLAIVMFLTTLSFLFSTPGWEPSLGGFPALAVVAGQFLLKRYRITRRVYLVPGRVAGI